ncbi:uncharacterized protein E0L32_010838 [Thyridium curvatum]|uniref:Uncharacterized protein n=1 Tax=Thyridium curvatum TaxID=1093900 RepID=A0A507AM17_9PEZI|nr:uncharacterized protein E0L32_010838 [Thyridium curvatum]TPX07244.1 hypothetical protein E0L32_010838 [Thyridium curvatum]
MSYGKVTVSYGSNTSFSSSKTDSTYNSYTSHSSGTPRYDDPKVRHSSYFDPTAESYRVDYVDRTKKSGDVVTVVNHHKRHYNPSDPSPSYSSSSHKTG